MPRVARNRTRAVTITGTSLPTKDGLADGATSVNSYTETSSCDDRIGRPVGDSPFYSLQIQRTLCQTGQAVGKPFGGHRYGTVLNSNPVYPIPTGGLTASLMSVSGGWYLDTVARSNPSRPVLTPATLIQDLVELPAMVRDVGRLLRTKPKRLLTPKELANQNLAVQFGWMPLVRDISQLLDLQSAVLKRTKELRRLYSGKGLRRSVTFGDDHQTSSATVNWSAGLSCGMRDTYSISLARKAWATIRWKPITTGPVVDSDYELHRLATRIVLGMTSEGLAKGTWDVIPWTWLLGWFTNVGSYLLASSNTVPATHSSACLMNMYSFTVTGVSTVTTTVGASSDIQIHGSYSSVLRTRTVSGALVPGFTMPFIDMGRLSILGSLYAQRFMR